MAFSCCMYCLPLGETECIDCHPLLQELTNQHTEKKQAYDTAAAGLESNMAKLEQVSLTIVTIQARFRIW